MPLQKIGINLTGLQNLTVPNFDIKNNSKDLINDIPIKANEITGGWLGIVSMGTLFTFLIYLFKKDTVAGGDFGYDTARSIGIASSIVSIIGLYMLNLGYFTNYFHVVIFIVMAFISVGIVYKNTI